MARPGAPALEALDFAGVALFLTGFLCEAIGDAQLARFKADPAAQLTAADRYARRPDVRSRASTRELSTASLIAMYASQSSPNVPIGVNATGGNARTF